MIIALILISFLFISSLVFVVFCCVHSCAKHERIISDYQQEKFLSEQKKN